jgi:hypothetical protein
MRWGGTSTYPAGATRSEPVTFWRVQWHWLANALRGLIRRARRPSLRGQGTGRRLITMKELRDVDRVAAEHGDRRPAA